MEILEQFGRTRKQRAFVLFFIAFGAILLVTNLFILQIEERVKSLINLFASFLIIAPMLLIRYYLYRADRQIEARFPDFLRDVADAINSGMTLPQAVKHVMHNDYGALSKYVKQVAVQIDWGVPFEKIFRNFAEKTKNRVIKRAVSTIIETHRSGGRIADSLTAVTETLIEIEKIRKERLAHVYQQILTGYMIYFVFLGIMLGLIKFLLPGMVLPVSEGSAGIAATAGPETAEAFKEMFLWLTLIEGAFSGIAIGKMSEGTVIAGMKHSMILCSIGYAVFAILA